VVRGVTSTSEVGLGTSTDVSAADLGTAITGSDLSIKTSAGSTLTTSDSLTNANVISVTNATTVSQATAVGEVLTTGTRTAVTGEALDVTITGGTGTDASRLGGTYTVTTTAIRALSATNVATTGGTATAEDATFTVVVDDVAGTTTVSVADGGDSWSTGDVITIPASEIGGAGGNLTFTINNVTQDSQRVAGVYTVTTDDYTTNSSSNGTGATFKVSIQSDYSAVIEIQDGGSGYATTDTITIQGSFFGGNADASDLTFKPASIGNANGTAVTFAEVRTGANAFQSGESYVIQSLGSTNSSGDITTSDSDAQIIARAFTNENGTAISGNLSVGQTITMATVGDTIGTTTVTQEHLDAANALIEGMTFTRPTETLTAKIEAVQALLNRARVEAGSQYAAMESAVSYTTDLTAQYELGFNTVNDVNFSAETAHLAKNQILQQAATAMLAQANSGQQGLLQLIQG